MRARARLSSTALVVGLLGLAGAAPAFAQDASAPLPPPPPAPPSQAAPSPPAAPTPPAPPATPAEPGSDATPDASKGQAAAEPAPAAPPAAAPPPAPPPLAPVATPASSGPPPEPGSKVPAIVVLGLAGVAAAVGTVFGVMSLGAEKDFEATPTAENADKVDQTTLLADVSFAATFALGVTGLTLLFSADPPAPQKAATRGVPARKAAAPRGFITPYAGPKGGGAAATFTF